MGMFIGEFGPLFFSFFCVCYHPFTYPTHTPSSLDGPIRHMDRLLVLDWSNAVLMMKN
jgi:hypothetical protein